MFFDALSAKRIGRATKAIEKLPRQGNPQSVKYGYPPLGFWARIKAKENSQSARYGWVALEPTDPNDSETEWLEDKEEWGEADETDEKGYAVEVTGLESVPEDSIVWLYPSKNQVYYLFIYTDPPIVEFTLTEDLDSSEAEATIGSGEEEQNITVKNYLGMWRGLEDWKGLALHDKKSDEYRIILMKPWPTMVMATTNQDMDDQSGSVDLSATSLSPHGAGDVGTQTFYNSFGFEIDSGSPIVGVWHQGLQGYVIIQAKCPADEELEEEEE